MAFKVLIVEDDLHLQLALKKKLQLEGYDVEVAINGQEGLNLALSNKPDLVLLDFTMPKMSGAEVLKQLREDSTGQQLKVIILTNHAPDDHILDTVVRYQPSYYCVKAETPIETIIQKVREVIGN